ncbi:HD domain-containing protein [Neolewinella persica]|uniref:HD domain-containing protein n=1 Tax=Neolewinella persica TaxID=70998 RepID=UPI0003619723|nr:HD domain-containing protein [Neolewinella persica]
MAKQVKKQKSLAQRASRYITRRLIRELPHNRIFHNLHHTLTVLRGVKVIGKAEGLSREEMQIVKLAAIFHDSGHVECYKGHEAASMRIAEEWLRKQDYPEDRLARVLACIEATTMPQHPRNKVEEILCDADLRHLAFDMYSDYQELLRVEWKLELGIEMTDEEWEAANNKFLTEHRYFTAYGRRELEPDKPHPLLK